MEKRKVITITLAIALALTMVTITSFASDTASQVLGLYPLAQSIVTGVSKGHSTTSDQPNNSEGMLTGTSVVTLKPEVNEIPTS